MHRVRSTLLLLLLSLLVTLTAAGCRRRTDLPDPGIPYSPDRTSEKLATFIFKEEGRLYLMTVGVNATRFHDEDAFIPLALALVNKTTTPLEIHRESFTLVDPVTGARYGLASIDEVRRQGKQLYDQRLMDVEHLLGKLSGYRQAECNFFPYSGLVIERIELHQFQYILDTIYFPRPEGELLGRRFELHVNARGLQQPLFVVFTIPEK